MLSEYTCTQRLTAVLMLSAVALQPFNRVFAEADGPDCWAVRGVAAEDVLNIRMQPFWQAEKTGDIPANGRSIKNLGCVGGLTYREFVELDKAHQQQIKAHRPRWCRVEYHGVTGWVAGRYLREGVCSDAGIKVGQADRRVLPDPMNADYRVEGETVTLTAGRAETVIAGTDSRQITRISGRPVLADLDGDGQAEAVVILLRQNSGTGVFYYLSVSTGAVSTDDGVAGQPSSAGIEAVFLGDRLKLRQLSVKQNRIVVQYLDHEAGQAMSDAPALAVRRVFILENGALTEVRE